MTARVRLEDLPLEVRRELAAKGEIPNAGAGRTRARPSRALPPGPCPYTCPRCPGSRFESDVDADYHLDHVHAGAGRLEILLEGP